MNRSNAKATLFSQIVIRLFGQSDGMTGSVPERIGSRIALSSNDAI
jgi:hypothetical protein